MLWGIILSLIVGEVNLETPGHIGLSMMVNIEPSVELKLASEAQGANRAFWMIFWYNVEGNSARSDTLNYWYYDRVKDNIDDSIPCVATLGWGTPKWASRARWIFDTLMDHYGCSDRGPIEIEDLGEIEDTCEYYRYIYYKKIKDRYFPPRPDSIQEGDSMVSYMDLWLRFVKMTVSRYMDRIKHYEIWYEMDGAPPKYSPWKEDYDTTMRDTSWFFENFYIPTAKAIYEVCPECDLVLPPRAGGNTLYDSYASFIPEEIADTIYNNRQAGKFYGYYDRMLEYFSNHPMVSIPGSNGEKPLFRYIDIHLYPYRYAPYYVDSNGVVLDVLEGVLNIRKFDHPDHDTVTNYTIKGAIDLVDSLVNIHGVSGLIDGYYLTEIGYLTYAPDTTQTYDSINNIEAGYGPRMYEEKARYFLNLGTTDDTNRAYNIMEVLHNKVLNYDTAAIYYSMLGELLEYLNEHGKRVIMALPVMLKDMPYSITHFEPGDLTYGFLFDTRNKADEVNHQFMPRPLIYVVGLYQRHAGRKYLMTMYDEPFKHPEAPKVVRTDEGFRIYYTHGRRDITDQVVSLKGDTVHYMVGDDNDFCYVTTPVFRGQNHHIYIAEANGSGEIESSVEESEGDDDSPGYVEYMASDNPNEKIKYLFYRHNGNELWLHHRDEIVPGGRLISDWRGMVFRGSDSISYTGIYKDGSDTLFVAFVDYDRNRMRLHVLKFYKSYNIVKDEVVYEFTGSAGCGAECGIGNPVFIGTGEREREISHIRFMLLFTVTEEDNSGSTVYYLFYGNKGWDVGRKLSSYRSFIGAMKGLGYASTYVIGVLESDSVLHLVQAGVRETEPGEYELVEEKDIVVDSMVVSFDIAEYGGLWYVVLEKAGYDRLSFNTGLPEAIGTKCDTVITHIEEKFPESKLKMVIFKTDKGLLDEVSSDEVLASSRMLYCRTPVIYVDTGRLELKIWYNVGGYGTYVLKDTIYRIRPSVEIISYPRVIEYGRAFNIQFRGYPGGEGQETGVPIYKYEIIMRERGDEVVYDSVIYVRDTVPTTHIIRIPEQVKDTETWYTVEVTATNLSLYNASRREGPMYGRFMKIGKIPLDNRRWMVSSKDTVYVADGEDIKKYNLLNKLYANEYSMDSMFLCNMSGEEPYGGYYLNYYKKGINDDDVLLPSGNTDTLMKLDTTMYYALSHVVFDSTVEIMEDSFSSELSEYEVEENLIRVYKDTVFFVLDGNGDYKYGITTRDANGVIPVDDREVYLTSVDIPEKPAIATLNGKVYVAYEVRENAVRMDIISMQPELVKSYTFSGRMPELTRVTGRERDEDTVVLYCVEGDGSVVRATFRDTLMYSEERIYNSTGNITWLGVHRNRVIFTTMENVDSVTVINKVKYMEKNNHGVWGIRELVSITRGNYSVPDREFMMPWVYEVNDTFVIMTWIERVSWEGKTEYAGWIRKYNPQTGNIQSEVMSIKTGLYKLMPNPTGGVLNIRYGVGKKMRVKILVYDISGRRVKIIEDRIRKPGVYNVVWSGKNEMGKKVASGVYIITMKAGAFYRESKKIIMAR